MLLSQKSGVEILPAILVKSRSQFLEQAELVKPHVSGVHVDIMDDVFVPNKTIGPAELNPLPKGLEYSFHWMVKSPEKWIARLPGPHVHMVHVETINSSAHFDEIEKTVKNAGGKLAISLNPGTHLEEVLPYKGRVIRFLVMSVVPGFDGQKYIQEVEPKIERLRELCPTHEIEVDGGINFETGPRAARAGANILASASTIFRAENPGEAIRKLKKLAEEA
jgi:ribulose-phosphate 3-epimerase